MSNDRKNFYNDRLHPSARYQSEKWYWPTDEEMALIERVVREREESDHYVKTYGNAHAVFLRTHLLSDGGRAYVWLAKNLQTPTDDNPLTEEQLLASLQDFDQKLVEPWLSKHGTSSLAR